MGPASFYSATFSTRRSRSCAFATVHNLHIQHVRGFSLFRFDKKMVADSVKIGFQCYTPQVFDYSLVFFSFLQGTAISGLTSASLELLLLLLLLLFLILFSCFAAAAGVLWLWRCPAPVPPSYRHHHFVSCCCGRLTPVGASASAWGGCEAPETRRGPGGVACCIVGVGWGMILTCRERFRRASPPR